MSEFFVNIWIIQVVFVLVAQGFVFMSLKTNRPKYGWLVLMTGIYMIPVVGFVYVVVIAMQAFRPVPQGWAGEHSVFDALAEGYEE